MASGRSRLCALMATLVAGVIASQCGRPSLLTQGVQSSASDAPLRVALTSLPKEIAGAFELPRVTVFQTESLEPGPTTWELVAPSDARLWLRARGTQVYGLGRLPGGHSFEVHIDSDGAVRERWGDTSGGIPCSVEDVERLAVPPTSQSAKSFSTRSGTLSSTIDVLVMYTLDALESASASTLRCRALMSTQYTNRALHGSAVAAQLRLVAVMELPFRKTGTLKEFLLQDLDPSRQPVGTALFAARQATSADIAVVFVGSGSADGLAHVAPTGALPTWWPHATAVIPASTGIPAQLFAHEVGHLFGAGHESHAGSRSYAHAHRWGVPMRYTIMATLGATLVDRFSNPLVDVYGAPTGVAGRADNARVLNEHREIVERWAPSPSTLASITCP